MTDFKACKDCKHYVNNWRTFWSDCCSRTIVEICNPVTGEIKRKVHLEQCVIERMSPFNWAQSMIEHYSPGTYCGKEGRYWEAK